MLWMLCNIVKRKIRICYLRQRDAMPRMTQARRSQIRWAFNSDAFEGVIELIYPGVVNTWKCVSRLWTNAIASFILAMLQIHVYTSPRAELFQNHLLLHLKVMYNVHVCTAPFIPHRAIDVMSNFPNVGVVATTPTYTKVLSMYAHCTGPMWWNCLNIDWWWHSLVSE